MNEFFSNYQLYQKFELSNDYKKDALDYATSLHFKDITFDYHCLEEGVTKTFVTKIDENEMSIFGSLRGDIIPQNNLKNGMLDYAFKCIGYCQSCKKNQVYFLLHISTFPTNEERKIFVEKVGVSPQMKILPKQEVTKFFDRESNKWYYKGINAISDNYGIGSLAYFRRIIEKELIHIIEEIKKLPDAHSLEIQSLLDEHKQQPTVSTIYEKIFQHLPNSLKSLGDNPIKLLYNQTSEGLHSMTEDKAMEKARIILQLLDFVIIKINEERSNIQSLKEAIKFLKE